MPFEGVKMKKSILSVLVVLFTLITVSTIGNAHENGIFLVDVSGTVAETPYIMESKILLQKINSSLPGHVKSTGLLTFGNVPYPGSRWLKSFDEHDKDIFLMATKKIKGVDGPTPIGSALNKTSEPLSTTPEKTAIIILSDGKNNGFVDPVSAANSLKEEYQDNICIFAIQLGDCPAGRETLENIVEAGGCGTVVKSSALESDNHIKKYVDYIFAIHEPEQNPPDSDRDGVPDEADECPATLKTAPINAQGCWELETVNFDSARTRIKSEHKPFLDTVADVMRNNPGATVLLRGHADIRGRDRYNYELSHRRTDSILNYLVKKGVKPERVALQGYGYHIPVADNSTKEGRAENRRIELIIYP
jgi:outer membrane protein OmpA-like peptidoglycan-associated protein